MTTTYMSLPQGQNSEAKVVPSGAGWNGTAFPSESAQHFLSSSGSPDWAVLANAPNILRTSFFLH